MDVQEVLPDTGEVISKVQTTTTTNTTPSTKYIETTRAALVALALCGTIGLAWKYAEALTPALVVLGGVCGGYFGVSQGTKNSQN